MEPQQRKLRFAYQCPLQPLKESSAHHPLKPYCQVTKSLRNYILQIDINWSLNHAEPTELYNIIIPLSYIILPVACAKLKLTQISCSRRTFSYGVTGWEETLCVDRGMLIRMGLYFRTFGLLCMHNFKPHRH